MLAAGRSGLRARGRCLSKGCCRPTTDLELDIQLLSQTNESLYDVPIEAEELKVDGDDKEALLIRIALSSRGSSAPEFVDEFIIRHEDSLLLREVLRALHHCFVRFDANIKTFSFALSDNLRQLTTIRHLALPKTLHSKEEAIQKVLHENADILDEDDVQWTHDLRCHVGVGSHNQGVPGL